MADKSEYEAWIRPDCDSCEFRAVCRDERKACLAFMHSIPVDSVGRVVGRTVGGQNIYKFNKVDHLMRAGADQKEPKREYYDSIFRDAGGIGDRSGYKFEPYMKIGSVIVGDSC